MNTGRTSTVCIGGPRSAPRVRSAARFSGRLKRSMMALSSSGTMTAAILAATRSSRARAVRRQRGRTASHRMGITARMPPLLFMSRSFCALGRPPKGMSTRERGAGGRRMGAPGVPAARRAHRLPFGASGNLFNKAVAPPHMVILSPHLDDAVFSCGGLLTSRPGGTVVTVFAGLPAAEAGPTDWDARCGFASGAVAMQARRDEDARALAMLDATPHWLDFLDAQYGQSPSPHQLGEALLDTLRTLGAAPVVLPMGLFHSDHLLVHEAALWALRRVLTDW